MKSQDVEKLIANGENENVEFKVGSAPPDLVSKAVCAFLNQHGGRVLLGVSEKGEVVGVKDADAVAQRIESQLPGLVSPPAMWIVETVRMGERDVVVVEVPEGLDKPYVSAGAIYFRRGAQVVMAGRDEISALIRSRSEASQRWERQIAVGIERNDLDDQVISDTTKRATESERWQGSPEDVDGFLTGSDRVWRYH